MQETIQWGGDSATTNDRIQHLVRESFRRKLFSEFQNSARRDADILAHSEYDETLIALARQQFSAHGSHAKAIMIGAFWSHAKKEVRKHFHTDKWCPFCHENIVADLDHLIWFCSHFVSGRPPIPDNIFQRRLGWPIRDRSDYNQDVISHMAAVRSHMVKLPF